MPPDPLPEPTKYPKVQPVRKLRRYRITQGDKAICGLRATDGTEALLRFAIAQGIPGRDFLITRCVMGTRTRGTFRASRA